jgi:ferrous iron transport protein B
MTVEDTIGRLRTFKSIAVVDLPGLYNLSHPFDEEKIVAHELFGEHFHKIINIVGAESIKRDLFLSLQCLETGMMSTLIVNMVDEINTDAIDFKKLSKLLNNVKVIPTQANRKIGLLEADVSIKDDHNVSPLKIKYSTKVESYIQRLIRMLPNRNISPRFYALMLLEDNQYIKEELAHHYPKH